MQIIAELVELIRSHQMTRLDIVGQPDSSGKISMFYEAIKSGQVHSDKEAAELLNQNSEKSAAYKKIKQRLKNRLVNSLLFIDTQKPSFTKFQQAYYNSHRIWAAARVAMGRGARQAATDLSRTVLRQALKYEFTDLAVLSARLLARNQADMNISQKEFESYNKIVLEQLTHFHNETIAEVYYNDIVRHFATSKSPKPEYLDKIKKYVSELRELQSRTNTFYFNILYYTLYVLQYETTNEIHKMIQACEQALEYFENRDFAPASSKIAFLSRIMYGSLVIGNHEQGLNAAEYMVEITEEGSLGWFSSRQPLITLYLRTKNYAKGYELYVETVNHPRFTHLGINFKEIFTIYSAAFYFLYKTDNLPSVERRIAQFRLYRFLNSVPNYTKDKRGLNVTILVFQSLIYVIRGEVDDAYDRIDSLSTYRARYLKGAVFERTKHFIGLLKELARSGFRPRYLRKPKITDMLQRLETTSNDPTYHLELEIIPFQDLWHLCIEWLQQKER